MDCIKAKCYIRVKTEEQLEAAIEWGRWDALIIDAGLMKVMDRNMVSANRTKGCKNTAFANRIKDCPAEMTTDCPLGQITDRQADQTTVCQSGKIANWQACQIANCTANKITNCPVGQIINCTANKITNCPVGQITNCPVAQNTDCLENWTADCSACNMANDSAAMNKSDLVKHMSYNKEIYIDLPDAARESRTGKIRKMLEESSRFTGVVIKNIDELGMVLETGYKGKVIADPFLYAFNNYALDHYLELIPDMIFIANDELTDREASELRYGDRMIRKIYGYQQLMITAQCLSKNHTQCREKVLPFKDGKGNTFYSVSSCEQCYSIIYNGIPTSMTDKSDETGDFLLDFTIENKEQVKSVLQGNEVKPFTRGHHFKGID